MPLLKQRPSLLSCLVLFCCGVVVVNIVRFTHTQRQRLLTEAEVERRIPPKIVLASLQPFLHRSRTEHNITANRIAVRGIAYRNFSRLLQNTPHHEALSIRKAFETYALLPCRLDRDMIEGNPPQGALFIALVVKDVAEMMPNNIIQLCRLALHYPLGQLFISVYESGSLDATPEWLLVLRDLLNLIRCPNSIVINGALKQRKKTSRSEFLSELRNAAMRPLQHWKRKPSGKVVFIDDVYFCAQQILRLYKTESDIACGMDFIVAPSKHKWSPFSRQSPILLTFHDVWSSIDITGSHFKALPPFLMDAYGRELLYKGNLFPVHSCANSLVAMRMRPFFENIAFRGRPKGECPASEFVLLCEDFARKGFTHITIDPAVRVTSDYTATPYLHHQSSNGGLVYKPFIGADRTIGFPSQPIQVECCVRLDEDDSAIKFKVCTKKTLT